MPSLLVVFQVFLALELKFTTEVFAECFEVWWWCIGAPGCDDPGMTEGVHCCVALLTVHYQKSRDEIFGR